MDALLRLHCRVEPDALDDEARITLWYDYLYARQSTRNLLLGVLRQAVSEAFGSKQ